MLTNNDLITFEEASIYTGIDKYTLGRVKKGYLSPFIENKKFNIKKYQKEKERIEKERHKAHCLYYALIDYQKGEENASKWLSSVCGRKEEKWLSFLEFDLFKIEKNDIILSWFEKEFTTTVHREMKLLHEDGIIDLEDYFY